MVKLSGSGWVCQDGLVKLSEIDQVQLVMFGWLVVIGLVGWVGLVRLGWSCQVGHVRLIM